MRRRSLALIALLGVAGCGNPAALSSLPAPISAAGSTLSTTLGFNVFTAG
jgi:hypothetical protein